MKVTDDFSYRSVTRRRVNEPCSTSLRSLRTSLPFTEGGLDCCLWRPTNAKLVDNEHGALAGVEAGAKRRSSGRRSRETKNKFATFSGLDWRCEQATSWGNPTASPKTIVNHLLKQNRSVKPYL